MEQKDIAKLLRFESSALGPGELTSLDDYIARCPPDQNKIYYLVAPHRGLAETSPYLETFKAHGEKTGQEPEVRWSRGRSRRGERKRRR